MHLPATNRSGKQYWANFTGWSRIIVLLAIPAALFLESCEGYRCANGRIIDKQTNLPLDSVLVEVVTSSKIIYTDTSGKFNVCNRMGGCVPHCKDIIVRFSKNGYQTVTLTNPEKELTVILGN